MRTGSGNTGQPPTTTEPKLNAVTFKGAYLTRENIETINALFAAADHERSTSPMQRTLSEIDSNVVLHVA